ncbi:MAG: signal peptidase II [Candidatus Cloacimonetes bacterium 4572_65]|nr:MAG: signal peptidase II [Candidatus Cloacimonetes bacterium 4572_65]
MIKNIKFFLIPIIIILLDQITKYLVRIKMPLYHSIDVFGRYFRLTHLENPGAAFSLSLGKYSRPIFISLTFIVILLLVTMIIKAKPLIQKIYFNLILGGATGNLIDRIIFGSVTDFLDCLYPRIPSEWNWFYSFDRWPTFNVADSAIVVGIILFAFDALILENKRIKSLEEA